MKNGYQIKEVKLKILNEQIDKFTHNRLELRKEFKKSHDERSQIMKETRFSTTKSSIFYLHI